MVRKLVWVSTLAAVVTALVIGTAAAQYRGYGDSYGGAPDYYSAGPGPYGGPDGGGPYGPYARTYGDPRGYADDPYAAPPPRGYRGARPRDFDERDYGYGYDQGGPPYAEPYDGGRAPGGGRGDEQLSQGSQETTRTQVANTTNQPPGTIVINTAERHLYFTQPNGQAIQYGIGVGREGFAWKGTAAVKRKAEWPDWVPPADMLKRRPDLPTRMEGGIENPLGARALYLFNGKGDTGFRIHGTNEPDTIGKAVSSGCIRMMNADVIDLYRRVPVGTKVVVL